MTSVDIEAPAATVWGVLSDIERWPEWTETVTGIDRLDSGPFAVGSRFRIKQPRLGPATFVVTGLEANRGFTWVTRSPGVMVTADHQIEASAAQCRVTLSVRFGGFLGTLAGWATRGLTNRYLALEAAGLKRRSEEVSRRRA
ncbi:MAG: SRPBCC family protein [Gemmatimonadales bacterium]